MVWNLGFYSFSCSIVIDTVHIWGPCAVHTRTHTTWRLRETVVNPFVLGYPAGPAYRVGLSSFDAGLTALTVGNNWPLILAGISSPWVHPSVIMCWSVINRGFLSFHFLLTLSSPVLEISRIINFYSSDRFPFTQACFQSVSFVFTYSVHPCYPFKNKQNKNADVLMASI